MKVERMIEIEAATIQIGDVSGDHAEGCTVSLRPVYLWKG